MKTLYMISGTMGVGKTTTSQALKKRLNKSVFLDGDWCWDSNPFQVNEETKQMVLDNICYLLNNFIHCSAYEHVIFCWVMNEQSIIDSVLERIDTKDCTIKSISLVCQEEHYIKRFEKDVHVGVRTNEDVQRGIERLPMYQNLNTIKVDTTGKSVEEVVNEVLKV